MTPLSAWKTCSIRPLPTQNRQIPAFPASNDGFSGKFAPPTRFDALAWRFFAKQEGVSVEELIASDSPAHLIDYVVMGNRYLEIRLRGVELPEDKFVPHHKDHHSAETGIYDWRCFVDLTKKTSCSLTPVPPSTKTSDSAGAAKARSGKRMPRPP